MPDQPYITLSRQIQSEPHPRRDLLVRPEHILQLVTISGPNKIKSFARVSELWQTINNPGTAPTECHGAVEKLSVLSSIVKDAVKQGDTERVTLHDVLENLNLAVGPKACGICFTPLQTDLNASETTKLEILAPISVFPILLPCCHIVCYGCIQHWLRNRATCPSCDLKFENVDTLEAQIESQVRRYDDELAEVLDLL